MTLIAADRTAEPSAAFVRALTHGIRYYSPGSEVCEPERSGPWSSREKEALAKRLLQWRECAAGGQHLIVICARAEARAVISSVLLADDGIVEGLAEYADVDAPIAAGSAANFQRVFVGGPLPEYRGGPWLAAVGPDELSIHRSQQGAWDGKRTPTIDRVARWVTQREVGIALSVGAAAGLVQMGLLAELEDAGVPLDFVCGSSMGGIVAMSAGRFASAARAADELSRHSLELARSRQMQWLPRSALVSEQWARRFAITVFGDATFADLRYPGTVVAADLVAGERVNLDCGPLAVAAQATSAIPGIFPPMHLGNRVLVDGGLVSRVPADLLTRRRCGLSLAAVVRPERQGKDAPLELQANGLRLAIGAPFGLRAVLGSSWRMLGWWDSASQARTADFVVDMPVRARDGFNFAAAERLIELGRRSSHKQVQTVRESFLRLLRPGAT